MFYIAEKTGWSEQSILNSSFIKLNLMLADAPRLIKKTEQQRESNDINELKNFFGVTND